MSKANDLTCSSHFVTHGNPIILGVKWQKWRQVFIFYLAPKDITDTHQKKTLMLQDGSTDLQEIYLTLNIPPLTNDSNVYDYACTLLDNHILPKKINRVNYIYFAAFLRGQMKLSRNMLLACIL